MTILDNYMFQPLLAIFRLSSKELKAQFSDASQSLIRLFENLRTLSSLEDNLKMASKSRNM